MKGSKNIEIYLVRLSDEGWEQEKWIRQEPSNPIWTAYGLDIYLAMPKRSVAVAPNTTLELSIILISPDGSNDLPHFAMLIRLYVIKLSIIVLHKILLFLNIFVALKRAYFCIEITKNHNKSPLKVNFRAHICGLRPRIKRHTCTFGRRLALRAIAPKLRSLNAAHLQENRTWK